MTGGEEVLAYLGWDNHLLDNNCPALIPAPDHNNMFVSIRAWLGGSPGCHNTDTHLTLTITTIAIQTEKFNSPSGIIPTFFVA